MIKLIATNGDNVVIDLDKSWDVYNIGLARVIKSNDKKKSPTWLQAALVKWGYDELNISVDSMSDIKSLVRIGV